MPVPRSELALRPSAPLDAGEIQALFSAHLAGLGVEPDPSLDQDMADVARAYPPGAFWVATGNGHILGMAGLLHGEVRRLFVSPPCRRAGMAGRLITQLAGVARAQRLQEITAVVARGNAAATAFFRSAGFQPTGRAPAHPKMVHCEIFERPIEIQP